MKVFRTHLLFCALIASLGGNAAEKFSPYKDVLTRGAGLPQGDDSSQDVAYRLPKSIRPVSYKLLFMPDLKTDFMFGGIVDISAVVQEETDTIMLNVGDITVDQYSVLLEQNNISKSYSQDNFTETFTITVSQTLKKGSEILISFRFHGKLRDDMIGLYRSSYFDENGEIKWLAATQFEEIHARHAFPCFDEPSFKANFTIRILRDKTHTSLSNMPRIKSEEMDNNLVWDTFQQTVPMSTYLIAIVISEFKYLEQDKFKVWARPAVVDRAAYALTIGTAALELLGNQFNQKYDLPKMDMVAVPDFMAGAMENWGLVTYRESRMLYDQEESSALAQQAVASVVVHELTHMWFGNLVTPEWWSYLWLSESFANYFEYFATAAIETTWNMMEQFVVNEHQPALIADGLESAKPMTREVSRPSQIEGIGDAIIYARGSSIVRMMNLLFGDDVFKLALRDYIRENKGTGLGNPNALWAALQTQIKRANPSQSISVKTVMDTWTTKAGYPVVSVTIDDKGVVHVAQKRFLLRNLNDTSTDVTWWVPLTWQTQSKSDFNDLTVRQWLNTNETTLNLRVDPKEWVIFNVQSSGFYRVNYNSEGWRRIFDVLHSDKYHDIHVLNRAALVDDLLNLGRARYQKYDTVLDGITYLKRERNYLPFKAALNGLSYLDKRFRGYKEYSLFKQYVLSLIGNERTKLGYEDGPGDSTDRLTVLLRRDLNIWACNLDDEECVTTYVNKFQKWKADPSLPIKPNERAVAYCTGIRKGTSEDWEFLWKRYFDSDNAAEQMEIINALGCSVDTTILEKYLKYAISDYHDKRIRKQDSTSVFGAVYSSITGAECILDFVDKHYKDMEKYYGGLSTVATILDGASQRFSTQKLVDKFQDFVNKHKTEFAPILKSLETSLQVAKYELNWYKSNSASIIRWLRENNNKNVVTEPTMTSLAPPVDKDKAKYRLPTKVIPSKYTINLTPYLLNDKFTFNGKVLISVNVVEQTELIVLHSVDLQIQSVIVKSGRNEIKTKKSIVVSEFDFLQIELDRKVDSGTSLTIEITYTGEVTSEPRGFYRSFYTHEGEVRWLAATQSEPVHARKVFPCFDEPAMKATFTIQVCTESGFFALSNTEMKTSTSTECPSNYFVFPETVKMSTYLVAIVVSNLQSLKIDNKYAVFARDDAVLNQANYSLLLIEPLVKFFETTFNQKYPLSKLDMVALPDFEMSAMENWGLLTYRESSLLYDYYESPITSKQAIRNVIAHEIAHQWFGNLVSPLWWSYLWLNEGFGRYFQYHATATVFKDTTLESQFVVDHVHSAFVADSSSSTHPMTYEVYTPDEIQDMFDTISYAKAASVLRMVEKVFGRKAFYDALKGYLNKRARDVSTPDDLYKELQSQINLVGRKENIKEILDTWTTQPGYPVVHVDVQKDVVTLRQERFLFKRREDFFDDNVWHIPITMTSTIQSNFQNTTPSHWMTEKEMKIESSDSSFVELQLLIVNVQQSGFYRVNYNNWERLINALKMPSLYNIHEINRAAIIDDLMNLARANYVNYGIAVSATEYLIKERDYLPWRAFYNNLPYLNRRLLGTDMEDLYKKYLVFLIKPLYTDLTFMDDTDDDSDLIRVKNIFRMYTREWACKLDIADCVFHAMQYYQKKLHKPNSEWIPPNYRSAVYCTAMRMDKTELTYDFLWKEYEKSNVMADKLTILNSLACSENKDILEKLLLTAIEKPLVIRSQDFTKVFSNVYDASLIGMEVVINVIMNETNYDNMSKRFGSYKEIKSIVSALANRLSTDELYNKYRKLLDWLVDKEPAFKNFVDSYLADAQYEFDWYARTAPELFQALHQLLPDDTYRLPNTLYPELYNLSLTPYMEQGIFEGKVQIYTRVEENTASVFLNSHNLNITNVTVYRNTMTATTTTAMEEDGDSEMENIPSNHTLDSATQQLRIYLTEFINAERIMVDIEFEGILNDNMQGFYRSSYVDKYGVKRWLATTQFEPAHARQAFPCFDEPAFKSHFSIMIQRPASTDMISLSNMPLSKSVTSEKANYQWDIFETTTVKMPTYLVAFVVSEFKPLGLKSVGKINVWGRPEIVENGYFAHNAAVMHLNTLEKFTDIKYPLPKIDMVGIPDFEMGAMENWGLVTFREYGLFFEENVITAKYKKYLISVVAHELAHSWFGNLVTCQWWDYIWLNEGFAEYFEWYASDQMLPNYRFMDQFVVYELQAALAQDTSESAHPMTNPVKTPKEIKGIFDYVTYGKSACVLRMLFNAFDEKVHKSALRDYLKKHQGGNARPTDLWESFKPYTKIKVGLKEISIEDAMNTWTDQPGYPVVHAFLNETTVTLTQERFFLNNKTRQDKQNMYYWIPIHIKVSLDPPVNYLTTNHELWLGPEPQKVFINPVNEWFVVNYKQTGFYRVNYDVYSWQRLIEELQSDRYETIHVLNRAQIMDDLFYLARADYVNDTLWANATKYLIQEKEHLPWKAFINSLSYVYARFEGKSGEDDLKEYVLKLMSNAYKQVEFGNYESKQLMDQLHREMILQWACKLGHPECIKYSVSWFKYLRRNFWISIPANTQPAVYCTAIKNGTSDDWKFLWDMYLQSNFASEQQVILNALGCSTNSDVLYNYLMKIIDGSNDIRRQDVSTIFASVYGASQLGISVTLNFISNKLMQLHDYFGNWDDILKLTINVGSRITDVELYNKLSYLYTINEDKFSPEDVQSVHDTVASNLDWYNTHGRVFSDWILQELNKKPNSSATIEPLNIILMTFVALITYFLSCR